MIYRPSEQLKLIVYEDQSPAKCFEFNKKHFRIFLLILPVALIFLTITVIFLFSYVKNITRTIEENRPLIMANLEKEKKKLVEENSYLKESQSSIANRLNQPISQSTMISIISPIKGQKDLTTKKLLSIENPRWSLRSENITFQFNMINSTENRRLSGHILAFLQKDGQLLIYPRQEKTLEHAITQFNQGESFYFSRFRPVKISFKSISNKPSPMRLFLYIFSREGDLLYKQIIKK